MTSDRLWVARNLYPLFKSRTTSYSLRVTKINLDTSYCGERFRLTVLSHVISLLDVEIHFRMNFGCFRLFCLYFHLYRLSSIKLLKCSHFPRGHNWRHSAASKSSPCSHRDILLPYWVQVQVTPKGWGFPCSRLAKMVPGGIFSIPGNSHTYLRTYCLVWSL